MGQSRPTIVLDLVGAEQLANDIAAGGVFVPDCTIALNEDCELVLRAGGDELSLTARVVFTNERGAGLQLHGCDASIKERIAALAARSAREPEPEPEPESSSSPSVESDPESSSSPSPDPEPAPGADADDKTVSPHTHERLRNLPLVEQLKIARTGELSERIVLERLYGKTVWEALLRNPRLTAPEVARIARMGALPRVLLEVIFANGAWLQIPEVRRALLANPRLSTDQIMRVLRLLPKHELKMAAVQTAYSHAVRDAARRLLRGEA